MIKVTDNAYNKIRDLMVEENVPLAALRMFVQGGGCAGYQYGFTFEILSSPAWLCVLRQGTC